MTMLDKPEPPRIALELRLALLKGVAAACTIALLLSVLAASFGRAQMATNEAAAVGWLRTINAAQVAYARGCGDGHYATTVDQLGAPPPGATKPYLGRELGHDITPTQDGYLFNLRRGQGSSTAADDCNSFETQTTYYAVAVPVIFGRTGGRAFATNQTQQVWAAPEILPPPEPFAVPSTRVQ